VNSENSRTLISRVYNGIAASPGIEIGHAFIYAEADFWVEEKNIATEEIEREKERFRIAIEDVINDIRTLKYKLEQKIGNEEAKIFDPHIMLLQDPAVLKDTNDLIEKGKNAEFSFFRTTRKITKAYSRVKDEYFRQRIDDITDILRRVHTKLQGKEYATFSNIKHPVIVIAPNLSPSDTANMHAGYVLAFVTDAGGTTSHATILARSLGIPAVIGVKNASVEIVPGDLVIVDGGRGAVYVNPDQKTIDKYRQDKINIEIKRHTLLETKDLPAVTLDGKIIGLLANIEFPDEVYAVLENGAEGIGLYRSEYHFIKSDRVPGEEELFEAYHDVAEKLAPKPVIIRTFDLGGDKIPNSLPVQPEINPFLGWRAIRVSLVMKDLFRTHLKAILRASSLRNVSVMFPMISSMDELNESLLILGEAKKELAHEGHEFNPDIPVGVMIEIPSAVMIAEHLANKVNFFSIGTNDLIQYAVAVDRTNDRIAYLYEPFHPGVLKLVKITIDAAHAKGIPVAVCGEMSNDPAASLLLLGMGIDELSMAPYYIPSIKRTIRSVKFKDIREIAENALKLETAAEIKNLINNETRKMGI